MATPIFLANSPIEIDTTPFNGLFNVNYSINIIYQDNYTIYLFIGIYVYFVTISSLNHLLTSSFNSISGFVITINYKTKS